MSSRPLISGSGTRVISLRMVATYTVGCRNEFGMTLSKHPYY
jgi:hypothetical protein